ncbi:unnamed protein product, partial [Ectocarpus sp. 12 AP-2014]
ITARKQGCGSVSAQYRSSVHEHKQVEFNFSYHRRTPSRRSSTHAQQSTEYRTTPFAQERKPSSLPLRACRTAACGHAKYNFRPDITRPRRKQQLLVSKAYTEKANKDVLGREPAFRERGVRTRFPGWSRDSSASALFCPCRLVKTNRMKNQETENYRQLLPDSSTAMRAI